MAKTSNRTDTPKIKKQTPIKGTAGKAAKFSNDWLMPQNASDVAMLLFPYGKVAKGVGRAVKKVIKPASKTKKVTKLAEPKSNVRVKPAAKQVGNPPNDTKAWESVLSSASRGGVGKTMAKAKDVRKFKSSVNKTKPDVRIPARTPEPDGRGPFTYSTVKINSAKPTRIPPRKKSAAQLRPKKK
jgi:hypothetical protein